MFLLSHSATISRGIETRTRILTALASVCATHKGLVEITGLTEKQVKNQTRNLLVVGMIHWLQTNGQIYYYR